jgi:hypothetical protein
MSVGHEVLSEEKITTFCEFSHAVQQILDGYVTETPSSVSGHNYDLTSDFDELCRRYPHFADEYLRAMAADYEENN